ncbi:hypothetical protein CAC42_5392 [Sphaceloma murrayae]|uniref:F-box domain-containing protein n=1 Tax=Sphaceloma murrayae TaxID=2082308 RepID=A0A2K1QVE1_9PEZI|nr:hypothetical protein CAC42_5392 [Sphaceloma murrayae]
MADATTTSSPFPHNLRHNGSVSRIRIHITTPHAPVHNLGTLSFLPPELVALLLPHLDLLTLSRLRRVNRFALLTINHHPVFALLLHCHPTILRAIFATRASRFITLLSLSSALATTSCATHACDRAAAYLYLPLCHRACGSCIGSSPAYQPLGLITASRSYGLPTQIVEGLPHLFSVPGRYGPRGRYEGRVTRLVDVRSVEERAAEYHGSLARARRFGGMERGLRMRVEEVYAGEEGEGRRWMGVCWVGIPGGEDGDLRTLGMEEGAVEEVDGRVGAIGV